MDYPFLNAGGYFDSEKLGYKKGTITNARQVKEYEIELYDQDYPGGILNGKEIKYSKGSIAIFKPGDVRRSRLSFSCYYLHFMVRGGEIRALLDELPQSVQLTDSEKVIQLIKKTASLYPLEDELLPLKLTSYIFEFIAEIKSQMLSSERVLENFGGRDTVSLARVFITENFCKNIKLADIADHVNLTPNYFHTLFTGKTGKTPLEFLCETRISKAKYMLLFTDKTVLEISEECGFSSYNYFGFIFKKKCGATPLQYRKKQGLYKL